jgi:phosphatidate cytidylyltransferase
VAFLFNYFTRLAVAFEPVPLGSPLGVTGRRLIFYLVAVVKSMDTGAFLFGSVFGRHKLFPRISPNKTWEGFVGGIAAGLGASLLFFHACRSGPGAESAALGTVVFGLRDAVMLGVLLPAAGVLGDLLESLIKRGCGVKDSGRWIPGMGGMLDITDSLLVAAPVLYYYVRFVLK